MANDPRDGKGGEPAVIMIAVEDTAPERPAASAKGTVSPSAMPMTMSRTRAEAEKCFSRCAPIRCRRPTRP
jgi:hypothetical protein